jgi:hypothetical protein
MLRRDLISDARTPDYWDCLPITVFIGGNVREKLFNRATQSGTYFITM